MRFSFLISFTLAFAFSLSWGCGDPDCPAGSALSPEGRCLEVDASTDAATDADTGDAADTGCTPSGVDVPDPEHIDADCDGIDGELDASVFVAITGDDENTGTSPDEPVRSIERGVEVAMEQGLDAVLISAGTYSAQLVLADGVSLYGGYDALAGWARVGASPLLTAPSPVVHGADLTGLTLAELEVVSEDAPASESSVAIRLLRSSGMVFQQLLVRAGAGGTGSDGAPRVPAAPGMDGVTGGPAVWNGDTCPAEYPLVMTAPRPGSGGPVAGSCSCAAGGVGGAAGWFFDAVPGGSPPGDGGSGAGPEAGPMMICPLFSATPGGSPGTASSTTGGRGDDGAAGVAGAAGEAGASMGVFAMVDYTLADGGDGRPGSAGAGGGGGGGGYGCGVAGFCEHTGGAGGGGGSGGCSGAGGAGGGGGGASVAVWLWESSVSVEGSTIEGGTGGQGGAGSPGGDGGEGGAGGAGGAGGTYECNSGAGGGGGVGGDGGDGGGGGGGGGGPSVGVLVGDGSNVTPDATSTITAGSGGNGGSGGTPGETGAAESTLML